MLNATFRVLHIDSGNEKRNYCADRMNSILSKTYEPLDSEMAYFHNFEEAELFYKNNSDFVFNSADPLVEGGGKFPPNSGTVGVWASNYLAYKKFLETDKDVLFIFEDDAIISPNFAYIVEQQMRELPKDWDVFTVFVPNDCLPWYNQDYDIPEASDICRTYQDWSCAAYAISRGGAEKAVEDVKKNGINDPIDWYIFNAGFHGKRTIYFNTYSVKPSVYRPVWLSDTSLVSHINLTEPSITK